MNDSSVILFVDVDVEHTSYPLLFNYGGNSDDICCTNFKDMLLGKLDPDQFPGFVSDSNGFVNRIDKKNGLIFGQMHCQDEEIFEALFNQIKQEAGNIAYAKFCLALKRYKDDNKFGVYWQILFTSDCINNDYVIIGKLFKGEDAINFFRTFETNDNDEPIKKIEFTDVLIKSKKGNEAQKEVPEKAEESSEDEGLIEEDSPETVEVKSPQEVVKEKPKIFCTVKSGDVPDGPEEARALKRWAKAPRNTGYLKDAEEIVRRGPEGTKVRGRAQAQYTKTNSKTVYRKDVIPSYISQATRRLRKVTELKESDKNELREEIIANDRRRVQEKYDQIELDNKVQRLSTVNASNKRKNLPGSVSRSPSPAKRSKRTVTTSRSSSPIRRSDRTTTASRSRSPVKRSESRESRSPSPVRKSKRTLTVSRSRSPVKRSKRKESRSPSPVRKSKRKESRSPSSERRSKRTIPVSRSRSPIKRSKRKNSISRSPAKKSTKKSRSPVRYLQGKSGRKSESGNTDRMLSCSSENYGHEDDVKPATEDRSKKALLKRMHHMIFSRLKRSRSRDDGDVSSSPAQERNNYSRKSNDSRSRSISPARKRKLRNSRSISPVANRSNPRSPVREGRGRRASYISPAKTEKTSRNTGFSRGNNDRNRSPIREKGLKRCRSPVRGRKDSRSPVRGRYDSRSPVRRGYDSRSPKKIKYSRSSVKEGKKYDSRPPVRERGGKSSSRSPQPRQNRSPPPNGRSGHFDSNKKDGNRRTVYSPKRAFNRPSTSSHARNSYSPPGRKLPNLPKNSANLIESSVPMRPFGKAFVQSQDGKGSGKSPKRSPAKSSYGAKKRVSTPSPDFRNSHH
uniref:PPIase cyclophilin-type domain-containing protein n=1 Tax=Rhabditophanes sp. KR3021 TaxID=114890 RepID=A0AC35TMX3_9BILA